MEEYAEVIVDVPAMQTDQPFTYRIPEALRGLLTAGMRVEVPFGKGNRHIQGFIMSLFTGPKQEQTKDIARACLF